MGSLESLAQRIAAEFDAAARRAAGIRPPSRDDARRRDARVSQFRAACERLQSVWTPRLEEFAREFGARARVVPTVAAAEREATLLLVSRTAWATLRFVATPALEEATLVLECALDLLPAPTPHPRHAALEMPLDPIDEDLVGRWIDDRLLAFLRTYHAIHEDALRHEDTLVEDPVTRVRFPEHVATCSLERGGERIHFASVDSMREYERAEASSRRDWPESRGPLAPRLEILQATPASAGPARGRASPARTNAVSASPSSAMPTPKPASNSAPAKP